ncbi:hypothetical protein [Myceligenerans indicum]|uniref:Tetracyclin repressor-like C-terminal domain-containing protein n=1 Tax=Myceligenerans indicum TaxID=2593663 RepID=A0ABS1LNX9_9MICO|nr:hypothetical protein [Myceligenerans indicum]
MVQLSASQREPSPSAPSWSVEAANLWQVAHPTPVLARLYEEEPAWGHVALDFEPRLTRLLQATARGLAGAGTELTPSAGSAARRGDT